MEIHFKFEKGERVKAECQFSAFTAACIDGQKLERQSGKVAEDFGFTLAKSEHYICEFRKVFILNLLNLHNFQSLLT